MGSNLAWKDLLVNIHTRSGGIEHQLVPAVPEPHIVWLIQGEVHLEEREIGGNWMPVSVSAGDLFLTSSAEAYEIRLRDVGAQPSIIMQVYVGLPLLLEANREISGQEVLPQLAEFSGGRDDVVLSLLELLRRELLSDRPASPTFVQSLGRALAIHLVRTYAHDSISRTRAAQLTAFQLQELDQFLSANLDRNLQVADLAARVGLSEFHFSRLFKKATGLSPSRYLVRLRMSEARRLLRETNQSILDICLEVGYSSPSHFNQVFRRESGVTPGDYRLS